MILLPVALMMCGYALLVFHWRSQAIRNKTGLFYDDRRGPLALTVVVVSALTIILLVSLADLLKMISDGDENTAHNESPMDWYRDTLIYRVMRTPSRH